MNRTTNSLPSFDVASGGLAGFSCHDDKTERQSYFQGVPVHTLNSPSSAYSSQSNADQDNAHPINLLTGFHVASLTQSDPDSSSYICNQSCFLGNEPDIMETTQTGRLNPDHHLTYLPAELATPQDSRPVAVVNPLSLQQATRENSANSAEIIGDKSSAVERKRKHARDRIMERRKNPAYAERARARGRSVHHKKKSGYIQRKRREHYRNNPVFAESHRIYSKIYKRMKDKIGKGEASKLALVAKRQYLQSVNSFKDSDDLPQVSNSAEITQNSNTNLDVLPLLPSQSN